MKFVYCGIVIAGAIILAISLVNIRGILKEIPEGKQRNAWTLLQFFVGFFLLGYLGFAYYLTVHPLNFMEALITIVFFVGAVYVAVVHRLFLETIKGLKRLALLERENITDPLMGIYNRRYLEARLVEEISRAIRYQQPLSLLLIDIDHFKKVNDTYGHQVGDLVLKQIGACLKRQVRAVDILARYGGEELAIVLPNTGLADATHVAENIRKCTAQHKFLEHNLTLVTEPIRCSVSIGVTSLTEQRVERDAMIESADRALYQAKADGRNRVVTAAPQNAKRHAVDSWQMKTRV